MMKLTIRNAFRKGSLLSLVCFAFVTDVAAHGETDWNDFKIDNKNNLVETNIQHVKRVISDVILGRPATARWPDPDLLRARDELVILKEDIDDMLNHFTEDGVRLTLTRSLRENPRAGRAVAGSYAIEIGIELLEHIASLDSSAAFEEELHTGGIGAYMFDLMDLFVDNMGLYRELTDKAD